MTRWKLKMAGSCRWEGSREESAESDVETLWFHITDDTVEAKRNTVKEASVSDGPSSCQDPEPLSSHFTLTCALIWLIWVTSIRPKYTTKSIPWLGEFTPKICSGEVKAIEKWVNLHFHRHLLLHLWPQQLVGICVCVWPDRSSLSPTTLSTQHLH